MKKQVPETLEDAIARRKEEAKTKNLERKADEVARYLGTHRSLTGGGTIGDMYSFERGKLKVTTSSGRVDGSDGSIGFFGYTVLYRGAEVFNAGGGEIRCFIPGPWETMLDNLQPEVDLRRKEIDRQRTKAEADRRAAEEKIKRAKWGL